MQGRVGQRRFFRYRRHVLLIRGCLRGLIKPDYPNGLLSRFRENTILEMLAFEDAAEKMTDRLALQQALLPVVDLHHLKGFVAEIQSNLSKKVALKDANVTFLDQLNKQISTTSLFRLFTAMERSGIIRFAEPTEENMDTEAFRAKLERDLAAGIIKPWGGIGQR